MAHDDERSDPCEDRRARAGGSLAMRAALLVFAAGCAATTPTMPTATGPLQPQAPPMTATPAGPPAVPPEILDAALADAGRRTGLDRAAMTVLGAERVTWADGSLGCPEPGRLYTQALVPGYRIRIGAGAQALDYHASASGPPRLCPAGRATPPVAGDARI